MHRRGATGRDRHHNDCIHKISAIKVMWWLVRTGRKNKNSLALVSNKHSAAIKSVHN